MLVLKYKLLKSYIEASGLKQKTVAEKARIPKAALCAILQGNRRCEVGEYARICEALGVPLGEFLKSAKTDVKEVVRDG